MTQAIVTRECRSRLLWGVFGAGLCRLSSTPPRSYMQAAGVRVRACRVAQHAWARVASLGAGFLARWAALGLPDSWTAQVR